MADFSKLDGMNEEVENVEGVDVTAGNDIDEKKKQRNAERREQVHKMQKALMDSIEKDPSIKELFNTHSDCLDVINTLGFGDDGNIVEVKGESKRNLQSVPKIIGYRIKNVGDKPVPYTTTLYQKNAEGEWVGTATEMVAKPGDVFDLTRRDMVIMCSAPEISFRLHNGHIVKSSARVTRGTLEEVDAFYFTFEDPKIKVNDDEVKLNVSEKVMVGDTERWVVKPQFEAVFGYMNNSKKKANSRSRKSADKPDMARAGAAYVRELLAKSGNV